MTTLLSKNANHLIFRLNVDGDRQLSSEEIDMLATTAMALSEELDLPPLESLQLFLASHALIDKVRIRLGLSRFQPLPLEELQRDVENIDTLPMFSQLFPGGETIAVASMISGAAISFPELLDLSLENMPEEEIFSVWGIDVGAFFAGIVIDVPRELFLLPGRVIYRSLGCTNSFHDLDPSLSKCYTNNWKRTEVFESHFARVPFALVDSISQTVVRLLEVTEELASGLAYQFGLSSLVYGMTQGWIGKPAPQTEREWGTFTGGLGLATAGLRASVLKGNKINGESTLKKTNIGHEDLFPFTRELLEAFKDHLAHGRLDEAKAMLAELESNSKTPSEIFTVYTLRGEIFFREGKVAEAIVLLEEAERVGAEGGQHFFACQTAKVLAERYALEGNGEAAFAAWKRAYEHAVKSEQTNVIANNGILYAHELLDRGLADIAVEILDHIAPAAKETGGGIFAQYLLTRAELLFLQGQIREAVVVLRDGLNAIERASHQVKGNYFLQYAKALYLAGDLEGALRYGRIAEEFLEANGEAVSLAARQAQIQALCDLRRPQEARRAWEATQAAIVRFYKGREIPEALRQPIVQTEAMINEIVGYATGDVMMLRRARNAYAALGDQIGVAKTLCFEGKALFNQGIPLASIEPLFEAMHIAFLETTNLELASSIARTFNEALIQLGYERRMLDPALVARMLDTPEIWEKLIEHAQPGTVQMLRAELAIDVKRYGLALRNIEEVLRLAEQGNVSTEMFVIATGVGIWLRRVIGEAQ